MGTATMNISNLRSEQSGFTLIELLVVVTIIGVLASTALPQVSEHKRRANIARTAAEIRGFATAFIAYESSAGSYPRDSHLIVPPGMANLLTTEAWLSTTPIGGRYNWEGPSHYPYAGISISGGTAPVSDYETLDRMLDDGNLSTGRFRTGTNGRPTFIIEE